MQFHPVYIVNRWGGDRGRAGKILGFNGTDAVLEADWGSSKDDKVCWELVPADSFNPNTGREERWNPTSGDSGSAGSAKPASGTYYYIVNRWGGDRGREGRMLGFSGETVCLEADWGSSKGAKVVWELVPADKFDPNTGRSEQYNPVAGGQGALGSCPAPDFGRYFYIVNRWGGDSRRDGKLLGFSGMGGKLESKWGSSGDKVVWEIIPGDKFNPNTGRADTWNPVGDRQGVPGKLSRPQPPGISLVSAPLKSYAKWKNVGQIKPGESFTMSSSTSKEVGVSTSVGSSTSSEESASATAGFASEFFSCSATLSQTLSSSASQSITNNTLTKTSESLTHAQTNPNPEKGTMFIYQLVLVVEYADGMTKQLGTTATDVAYGTAKPDLNPDDRLKMLLD